MTKWEKIECHEDGTYSISSKSGKRVTGPMKDLLKNVVRTRELRELIEKAKKRGKIAKECYTRALFDIILHTI